MDDVQAQSAVQAAGDAAERRLLLVDDDRALCAVLARALERLGYRVSIAHEYQAALFCAGTERPGYAVLDLKFPGGSGLQLLQRLVGLASRPRVVVLTGYASIATAIEAVKLGAHHYLTKPATADDIVAAFAREPGGVATPIRDRPLSVNRLQWEHIQRVLTDHGGNVSATARALGMHRRTLQRKLAKHPARN